MTRAGVAPGKPQPDRDRRKLHGVFYTPEPVARYMVASTLEPVLANAGLAQRLRVLDPACGDGALLWPAYQFLCDRHDATDAAGRLDLIQRHLFGVDLDGVAVERLRQRFRNDLTEGVSSLELNHVLDQNFRCGNAVSGRGWELPNASLGGRGSRRAEDVAQSRQTTRFGGSFTLPIKGTNDALTSNAQECQGPEPFHWCEQFSEVCAAGGFDVIIANPPYRRERGAKTDLQELEHSPLALAHRQARMDLWHYFFHRSLDLLRPGGMLTLIVNSYWTTSEAGQPLIERLATETTPLEFVLLNAAPVFAGVGGRHLITRLRKDITDEPCEILRLREHQRATVLAADLWSSLSDDRRTTAVSSDPTAPFSTHTSARDELFREGQLNLGERSSHQAVSSKSHPHQECCLGDIFEVRQGIAENPPRITRQQAVSNTDYQTGEGVFVLSSAELAGLELTATERNLVRPYYSAVEINKYWKPPAPHQWLLYLTRQTAPDLSLLPNIERHLARFRPILEQRRETRQGKIAWWHLHWPRESRLFERPRILALQMVQEPRFAYVETPTYVGFSVNVIVDQPDSIKSDCASCWSLESLAVVLNSHCAADWFDAHAKRRGVKLDITGTTLKQFPLPLIDPSVKQQLVALGRSRIELGAGQDVDTNREIQVIEALINELADSVF